MIVLGDMIQMIRHNSMLFYLKRALKLALGILIFIFLIQRSTYPTYMTSNAVSVMVIEHKFDYVTWTIEALWDKSTYMIAGHHHFMDEQAQTAFVRAYLADVATVQQLERQLDQLFFDNPHADTFELDQQRRALRDDLFKRQATAEAILESQISSILIEQGFGVMGQLIPPVSMRFTQMPNLLVISPRDRIQRQIEMALNPLTLAERAQVERQVESLGGLSALVVPLGGMALYPAMIQETPDLNRAVEVFAHEWVHHYFFMFPLGWNYFVQTGGGQEAMTINETVADIFGREIAEMVLARYYPEPSATDTTVYTQDEQPILFDYGATMHETRVNVDQIMARIKGLNAQNEALHPLDDRALIAKNQAEIDALTVKVERYMEHRRQIFLQNGYRIVKINQAFFAFYGGYQGGIAGIGGADPIGEAVRDIRAMSDGVYEFVTRVRTITTRAELLAVRDRLRDGDIE
jgi:hypothetical protein